MKTSKFAFEIIWPLQCQFSSFASTLYLCEFVNLQVSQTLLWKFSQILKSSVNLCTRPDRRCLPLASHCVIKVNCSSAKEATKSQSYVSQGGRGATINQIGFHVSAQSKTCTVYVFSGCMYHKTTYPISLNNVPPWMRFLTFIKKYQVKIEALNLTCLT